VQHPPRLLELLVEAHPINHIHIGEDMWMRAPHEIKPISAEYKPAPGLTCKKLMSEKANIVEVGSNGSVYLEENI
jgi:hypothetical protein